MKSIILDKKNFKKLIDKAEIQSAVSELAREISEDFRGKTIICICILKGASYFFSDLTRKIDLDLKTEFVELSSYGGSTESDDVSLLKDIQCSIKGKDVLIVEDIMDTSKTLNFLIEHLESKHPRSVRICTLIDKRERRESDLKADYTGFEIEKGFVVGYGMDFNELGRNLDDIYVLEK
ncbi:MAG: hypoxanthine phosphoribosyltransferase [Thermodesulfobacteriota bacterium]